MYLRGVNFYTMNKILVANRGEIALRIMRTCKKMGIKTVAVYSEADFGAPFMRFADEAICVGAGPSSESYLVMDKIIQAAKVTGAQGIHPGYGFLSENAEFSRRVSEASIKFIGPSPQAIQMMGSKLEAKAAAQKSNVPLVPGTAEAISDIQAALEIGKQVGFPLLIKASAGGGGKGMRIVEHPEEFEEQLNRASSEALNAFGDGSVFIEKYVTNPRHIEIQVLADQHGNYVYLFERDCSIQRRHQKVVEEAPSGVLTPEIRKAMGECAISVARACNYEGAGTVEFLYDASGSFYFLEMNTRLQVEHPVSEMITGLDLVEQQILVACGETLGFTQEDLKINGHALEIRVYAEDPLNNFLPDIGTLKKYRIPQGTGVRVDDGLEEGMSIPIYYDPMIAKLIVHAPTREAAIEGMLDAIDSYIIDGVSTTLGFCRFAIDHEAFRSGNFDTGFVGKYFSPETYRAYFSEESEIAAAAGVVLYSELAKAEAKNLKAPKPSHWKIKRSF